MFMLLSMYASLKQNRGTGAMRNAALILFIIMGLALSARAEACMGGARGADKDIIYSSGISLVINGAAIETKEPLWVWRGVTYLPLEYSLLLKLNLRVGVFNGEEGRTLNVRTNGTEIEFHEESCLYTVNGVERESSGVPMLDTTYPAVPLRVFFSAIGADIYWEKDQKKVYVVKVPEEHVKVKEVQPGIFAGRPKEPAKEEVPQAQPPAPVAEAATGTEVVVQPPVPEIVPESAVSAEKSLQYTYENTVGVDVSSVSGDETASSIEGNTIGHNLFSLRANDTVGNGYEMNVTMRAVETTDVDQKRAEFDKLSVAFSRDTKMFEMYDLYPKFSQYLLRLYRLQGVRYIKGDMGDGVEVVAGKTPKKVDESEYARYVGGASYRKTFGERVVRLNYAWTKDTGTYRGSEKTSNNVVSIVTEMPLMKGWKVLAEYAGSGTAGHGKGMATYTRLNYKSDKTRMEIKYERTGASFLSETSYYPTARSEFSSTFQRKRSNRLMYALGHKQRFYDGERTYFYPVSVTLKPLLKRTTFKVDAWREFQRTAGAEYESADERGVRLMDKIGKAALDINISRRKSKDADDGSVFRTTRAFKVRYPVTKKLYSTWQYSNERRQQSSTPLMRELGLKMEYEIAPWTDLVCNVGRYYNGTNQSNYDYTVGFRKVNIMEDWEAGMDVKFKNYSDHNDTVFKMKYTFIR